jgi:hypothetical protein
VDDVREAAIVDRQHGRLGRPFAVLVLGLGRLAVALGLGGGLRLRLRHQLVVLDHLARGLVQADVHIVQQGSHLQSHTNNEAYNPHSIETDLCLTSLLRYLMTAKRARSSANGLSSSTLNRDSSSGPGLQNNAIEGQPATNHATGAAAEPGASDMVTTSSRMRS